MAKISKRLVDTIRPSEQRMTVWDDTLKGFGIIVRPSSVHSYVFSYRNAANRKRNITIGKVGTLTPTEARKQAELYRFKIINGNDPLEEKYDPTKSFTVTNLIDEYLKSVAYLNKADSTRYTDICRIDRHIKPLVGNRLVSSIDMRFVEKLFRDIASGKTKRDKPSGKKFGRSTVRGGEGAARSTIRLFRAILSWGEKAALVDHNIVRAARNVDIGRDGKRETILDDPEAYEQLWHTLDRLSDPDQENENHAPIQQEATDAIKVIMLTGARKGEITNLLWEQVDLESGIISIDPHLHKTGRRTGDRRIIGLPQLAIEILSSYSVELRAGLVFKSKRSSDVIDLSKIWRRVREEANLPPTLGLHGLRHSLASHMAMDGASASEIMTALGHRDITSTQRYIHWALASRQSLAENAVSKLTEGISL
ncbi:phage integrase, putative [Rhodobacteraceae bacterium HTCC2083]|nr:phage integrase, putative [Rhodobacteraceae bacterium HTCC2083]